MAGAAIIADSDDESDANTFSPPPAGQLEELHSFASTTSEPVSLATSSTDPVFFQGVYNEQQDAAVREQRLRLTGGDITSLPLTAPTGTEQTDPVSLPSQYPAGTPSAVETDRIRASNVTKSAIMRGKKTRKINATLADPYAFPSSPEDGESQDRHHAGLRSSLKSREAVGAGVPDDENMGPPSRKRQRLDERQNNTVDSSLPPTAPPIYSSIPPTMPPIIVDDTIDHMVAVNSSNYLAPTIDINDDPSLIIHPRGLTSSQKEQYQAVELARSSHPEQQKENGDLQKQSNRKSQRQKTPSKKSTPSMMRSSKRLAKSQAEQGPAESASLSTPSDAQEMEQAVVLHDHEVEAYGENDNQTVSETKPEDDVYEVQPTPVKPPKKKRGRPKRAEKQTQAAQDAQSEPTESTDAGKPAKKRGRPKKSEAAVVEEQNEEVSPIAKESGTKLIAGDEATNKTAITTDGDVENLTALKDVKVDDEKTAVTPCVLAKVTPQKPAGNRIATPQTGSAGKPLYRIGLSKRSRIAPLLKTLPK
ncbi:AT hook, DNA-binding motif protein [Cordyceps fumosorosea ARSEF 2679]|uniref:AT hook, DNA-binding motif protein n=1 Tax=Cordyceps fumosorosea (strain ARSEF 2679) TaxID=1081104 RepID=A0A167W088_CORFA|nr:AT hook, DNA-binding motif protein [Cordyceps fumosorosea ARSEF 2679]OAA63173.1 AT hook, DNA-binding motif protein [Cordyceps fumosorosea ARSEF 2679]